jgi:hypothetical protein
MTSENKIIKDFILTFSKIVPLFISVNRVLNKKELTDFHAQIFVVVVNSKYSKV